MSAVPPPPYFLREHRLVGIVFEIKEIAELESAMSSRIACLKFDMSFSSPAYFSHKGHRFSYVRTIGETILYS